MNASPATWTPWTVTAPDWPALSLRAAEELLKTEADPHIRAAVKASLAIQDNKKDFAR